MFSDRLTGLSDPTAQRLAPRLIRTIDRAIDYTSSVLAYGKAGEALPKKSLVRLHRLCEDVAETLAIGNASLGEDESDKTIAWANDVEPDFEVEADAEQLFRVLLNLSRNAVQAMESQKDAAVVRRLSVQAKRHANKIHIIVSDTGPGFPEGARKNLFAAFHTSSRSGGTGLGLAIAAELVRAHGGSISLMETDTPGSHFEIVLPQSS